MLTDALAILLREPIATTGCGRTDAGVHATQFFAHFDAENTFDTDSLCARLNRFLPTEIAVQRIIDNIPPDAHARFDATYRAYNYYIHFRKSPFLNNYSYYYPWLPLDLNAMNTAAMWLLEYNDFRMFCKTGSDAKSTLCQIFKAELYHDPALNTLRFHIAANRFLRGMVRLIVGALLCVGKRKISLQEFREVMDKQLPRFLSMNISAPAEGLFLSEVRYPYL